MAPSRARANFCQAIFAACISASVFGIGSSSATSYTWTPTTSGTFNWNNASSQNNWGTGVGGAFPSLASDSADFTVNDLTGNETINLNTSIVVGNISLYDTNNTNVFALQSGSGSNTITFNNGGGGSTLTLGGLPSGASSSVNANIGIILAENLTFNTGTYGTQSLGSAITGNDFTLTKSGTARLNASGNYTGMGGLTSTNSDFFVSGLNTFNPGAQLKMQSGNFILNGIGGWGAGSTNLPTFVLNGGTTANLGVGTNAYPVANPISFTGDEGFGSSNYSFGKAVTFTGNVDLGNATRILQGNNGPLYVATGAGTIYLTAMTFSGTISNGALTVAPNGVVTLSGTNTYSGATTLQGGSNHLFASGTHFTTLAALPSASNLVLDGGNIELSGSLFNGNPFSRILGTGANQFRWSGNSSVGGGFAAIGASPADTTGDLTVSLGNLVWASSANFVGSGQNLTFGSSDANRMVTYTGNIDLNAGLRRIDVTAGVGTVAEVTVSGNITGTGASNLLVRSDLNTGTNPGVLVLSGTNTYSGTTQIGDLSLTAPGALRIATAASLAPGNLILLNGVLEGSSGFTSFTRPLGTGVGAVQWSASGGGGFSANGSNFTVNIGGSSAQLVWASTTNFVATGKNLVFGSTKSDHTVLFQNPIDLNGGTRTVWVNRGWGTTPEANLTVLSNSTGTGSLIKDGSGTLELSATNTYNGTTQINGVAYLGAPNDGALQIDSVAALPTGGLILNGGVLQTKGSFYSGNNFTYGGTITWTSGGFAAYGSSSADDLTVTAGLPDTNLNVVFGSPLSNRTVKYTAALANTTNNLSVVVNRGSSVTPEAEFTNAITGAKGLTLVVGSTGVLLLDGTNTYSGATSIGTGWLRINGSSALSANSNLQLGAAAGVGSLGILEGSSNFTSFTRSLGTTANTVQWAQAYGTSGGGFSASGSNLTVAIGGLVSPTALTWNSTANFVTDFGRLAFGSPYADSTVLFKNSVNLGTLAKGADGITPFTSSLAREIYVFKGQGSVPEVDLQGGISGSDANISLNKTGPGTLKLSAAATYVGPTTITGGTLLVNSTMASSSVTVSSGATLGGSGNIANSVSVTSGGTLSPGNSPGQLSVGSLSMASGSTLFEEINGTVAGSSYDQTNMDGSSGTVSISGANLVLSVGFTPAYHSLYTIILNGSNTAVTGTFASLPEGAHTSLTNPGQPDFQIFYDYNSDAGSLANDVVLIAVPEPASVGILGLSALALLVRRRKVQ